MSNTGRPRRLPRVPEDKRAEAVKMARMGRPIELIADKLGVSRDTIHAARVRGREMLARLEAGETLGDEDAAELRFVVEFNAARADRAFELQDTIEAAPDGIDWRALAWSLERAQPDVFGSRSKTEITGAEGGPVQVEGRAPALFIPAKKPDE